MSTTPTPIWCDDCNGIGVYIADGPRPDGPPTPHDQALTDYAGERLHWARCPSCAGAGAVERWPDDGAGL